ncbi:hypothetical protein CSC44_6387 [Pseudomonas aeruginosa]|nr:hypothetical protein CSC44_6387 [Pseudomonas aeruginosa]
MIPCARHPSLEQRKSKRLRGSAWEKYSRRALAMEITRSSCTQ